MTWSERVVVRDGVRLSCRDWRGNGSGGGAGPRHGHGGGAGHRRGGGAGDGNRRGGGAGDGSGDESGPAVVLLHGLAGHAGEWDPLAARLQADGHRVVAVDQRGHGASERRPEDTSRAAYVADTLAVLDQLDVAQPLLVGQSLGGHTAMLTAAAHPGRLLGLVLVEAGPGGPNPGVTEEIGGWLASWPVPFPTRDAAVRFLGGGPVGEGWADGLERRERDGGGWWPRFDPDVMVRSLAENATRAFWSEWEAVDCPTLAVVAQNGIIEPAQFDGMVRRRPGLRAASVPGTGHDLHLERPDALHHVLTDFLGELRTCHGVHSNS
ncbi:alpha/beta hydrolase [Streptomyces sp. ISL-36]|uniref:alpha/beta fold hydrolase n=1 Tax=Streptomyces sp. ISL-36 TaxID=2819182 RepID=UPI001BE9F3C5|nr:alpha/beta hydrolase [Streptomyces sp. ISL-36]MBT2441104.1 alpha/beta hydrolase [Streptomyces sp. ISL-36]